MIGKEQPAYWDDEYLTGNYRRRWHLSEPSRELQEIVPSLQLAPGCVTLDVGCGASLDTVWMAEQGFDAIGLDLSLRALELARQASGLQGSHPRYVQGNVLQVPLRAGTVGFVHDRGCFHHIPAQDRSRFAQEVWRLLEPGGYLLLRGIAYDFHGLVGIDGSVIDRYFGTRFVCELIEPFVLSSFAAQMEGQLALLRRRVID